MNQVIWLGIKGEKGYMEFLLPSILNDAESILYICKRYLGNLYEKEVIKYNGKYYRVQAVNKQITEFVEV